VEFSHIAAKQKARIPDKKVPPFYLYLLQTKSKDAFG
jgi:hypothetical protein